MKPFTLTEHVTGMTRKVIGLYSRFLLQKTEAQEFRSAGNSFVNRSSADSFGFYSSCQTVISI